jgi:glycosyltransferase involved in cell wall biosynthesis
MRIAIVIYSLAGGGAERVTCHLANAWAARGYEVAVVTLEGVDNDAYALAPDVERVGLGLASQSKNAITGLIENLWRIHTLRHALKKLQPDVVIGMMTTAGVLAVLSSIGKKWKVIPAERIHPPKVSLSRSWEFLRRWSYPRAAAVVTLAEESRHWIEANCPGSRSVVIPNPVVLPLPEGDPQVPTENYVHPNDRIILGVGRLDGQKGFDILIQAFSGVADSFPAWRLVVLGEGPDRGRLAAQVERAGLEDRILLPGRAGNMGEWYKRADLYVMSSRFEGFPNVLVEAMSHGLPAISFNCDTGPGDIIRHGVDGLLVNPVGDVPALIDALTQLMGDKARRTDMASRAIEVGDRYTMSRILVEWDRIFFEVLDERR